MSFSLSRGLSGAGGALEKAGFAAVQSSLDEARQKTLMELSHQFQRAENQATREHQSSEAQLTRDQQASEGAASRQLSRDLATQTDTRIREEGSATRQLQRDLAQAQESAADRRHGASIGLQRAQLDATLNQVQLIPQADGTFQRVRKDGTSMGTLTDLAGNPITGPKDVSASAKILIDGNNKIIAALAKDLSDAVTPDSRKALQDQMTSLQNENKRLLGMTTDNSQGSQPSEGDIAGLRARASNPQAIAAFEARYGAGSSAKYLGNSGGPVNPAAQNPSAAPQGLAAVLDQQRPRRLIRDAMEDEVEPMLVP